MSHFSFRGAMTQYRFPFHIALILRDVLVAASAPLAPIKSSTIHNASDYLFAMSGVWANPLSLH